MITTRWPIRATTLLTAVVLGGALVPLETAQAADPPTTVNFTVVGAHDWIVPADVLRVNVIASGGKGGLASSGSNQGGLANRVLASFRVTPGTVLHLHVGSNGAFRTAGANGGGAVGQFAGGGGGASDIRIGGDALANRVLVAAGGGGASIFGAGGAAGAPGSLPIGCAGSQPGTSSTGGSGGPSCEGGNAGAAGGAGSGGSGGGTTGGGGGGGYYGGGGGGDYGGGAGGSSLTPVGARDVSSALTSTAPGVSLTYAASSPESLDVDTALTTLPADDGASSTTVTATVIDQHGDHHPGDAVTFVSDDPAVDIGPVTDGGDGTYTAQVSSSNKSGTVTIDAFDSSEPAIQGSTELTMTALAQTVTFDGAAPPGLVVGQSYAPDATGGGSGNTVTFGVDPDTTGYGTAAAACSVSGATASLDHPGSCVLTADQAGNAQYSAAGTANQTVAVGQAASATSLSVTSSHLTAHVTPVAPGDGVPEGTVTFAVDGTDVGDAPVTDGVATLAHSVPAGEDHLVSATFSGGDDFTGSSTSTSRTDPEITTQLDSTTPATGGWYRAPVTVSFTCTPGGAALTAPCPTPVTLSGSAAGQSVTRTIEATDGGVATTVVSGINIDRVAPTARVSGVTPGSTYMGTAPAARCTATDALSGASSCAVRLSQTGQNVRFTATATDVAGNTGRTTGSYRVLSTYLRGVSFRDERFQVRGGRRYTILTSTRGSTAPKFLGRVAVATNTGGRRFHEVAGTDGLHHWAIRVRVRPRLTGPQRFYVVRVGGTRQPISLSVAPRRP